jgi:hypothetical protein
VIDPYNPIEGIKNFPIVLVFPMKLVRACPVLFLVSSKQKSRTSSPLPRWYSTP